MRARTSGRRFRRAALAAFLLAAIGLGVWLWAAVVKDRVRPKRWGVVEAGAIYRSGQLHPALVERTLREHGIRRVVSLRPDEPRRAEHLAEREAERALGIAHETHPLRGDATGDPGSYVGAIAAIVEARRSGEPVLVHCAAGTQRTGAVVAVYRMLIEGAPPSSAYQELEDYGWDPEDDAILRDYVNEHLPEIAAGLVDTGALAEVPNPLPLLAPYP